MNPSEISPLILEKAPLILAEIQKATSILLHCHPSPDPDSVCSSLAMKAACEQLGKKVTIIRGDAEVLSEGFSRFPGVQTIVGKSFSEVDLSAYDLFIALDSASADRVSAKNPPVFPLPIRSINIDHHKSNTMYADINLVDMCTSATCILYQLFSIWGIDITHDIAVNLFMGMYTDSGGFKYYPIDHRVFQAATDLVKKAPDFVDVIFHMENSQNPQSIYFERLALDSVETFLGDNIAMASVSLKQIEDNKIQLDSIHVDIPNKLKSVVGWNIGMMLVEREPGIVKVSMRSRDFERFDVSKLAVALGGGGHRAAAGIRFSGITLQEAKEKIVSKAKELYNL
ncbi:MAG TPA: DHH family phosphoesterase [Candidatus Paceibacterota bacterium]|nr:DHH family phosphoesterase [Candidatus Paceibacterota bacterium]